MIVLTKQRRGAVNASSGLGLNRAHLYKTKESCPKKLWLLPWLAGHFFPVKVYSPFKLRKKKTFERSIMTPPPPRRRQKSYFFKWGPFLGNKRFLVTRLHNACIVAYTIDRKIDQVPLVRRCSYQKMKCSLFNAFKLVLLKISLRLFRSFYWALTASNDSPGVHCLSFWNGVRLLTITVQKRKPSNIHCCSCFLLVSLILFMPFSVFIIHLFVFTAVLENKMETAPESKLNSAIPQLN